MTKEKDTKAKRTSDQDGTSYFQLIKVLEVLTQYLTMRQSQKYIKIENCVTDNVTVHDYPKRVSFCALYEALLRERESDIFVRLHIFYFNVQKQTPILQPVCHLYSQIEHLNAQQNFDRMYFLVPV